MKHEASLDDGRTVTPALFQSTLTEEMQKVSTTVGKERFESGMFNQAQSLFETLSTANEFEEFLTLPAYEQLVSRTLSGMIQE